MGTILIHAAIFLAGLLALAGFAGYICRGRPAAPWLARRQARERRTLLEVEFHLLTEVKTTGSDESRQIE